MRSFEIQKQLDFAMAYPTLVHMDDDAVFRARASSATRLSNIDVSTPSGLSDAYRLGAAECLQAAQALEQPISDLTGEYIVTFHAAELALKAFLIKKGIDADRLRSREFGHDLVRLYDAAIMQGLRIHFADADKMIRWINEWHCDGVKIRYEFAATRKLPMCQTIFPLIAEIFAAAKSA